MGCGTATWKLHVLAVIRQPCDRMRVFCCLPRILLFGVAVASTCGDGCLGGRLLLAKHMFWSQGCFKLMQLLMCWVQILVLISANCAWQLLRRHFKWALCRTAVLDVHWKHSKQHISILGLGLAQNAPRMANATACTVQAPFPGLFLTGADVPGFGLRQGWCVALY